MRKKCIFRIVAVMFCVWQSVLLADTGSVAAWGDSSWWQSTCVPDDVTNVQALAAGSMGSLVLRRDGNVVAWGLEGPEAVPEGLSNVNAPLI